MSFCPSTPQHNAALNDLKALFDADLAERDDDRKIDASEEQDWYSLTLGFFLAKGLSVEDAHNLSTYVRYDLQYWR